MTRLKNKITLLVFILLLFLVCFTLFKVLPYINNIFKEIYYILFPFLVSIVLALFLEPIVTKTQKVLKSRLLSIIIVLLLFLFIIFLLIYSIFPTLIIQVQTFIISIPNMINTIDDFLKSLDKYSINIDISHIQSYILNKMNYIEAYLKTFIDNFIKYFKISLFIPVILIIILYDYKNITNSIIEYFNKKNYFRIKNCCFEIKYYSLIFIKSYVYITIFLIIVTSILFKILGLSNYILLALIVGITNLIPIVGPFIGGAICTIYALTINVNIALSTFLIVFIIQLIESNFITPYIQAKGTKNHPLLVIFSLIIFGELFGVIGMIFSSLILTIIKIFYKYYKDQLISIKNMLFSNKE